MIRNLIYSLFFHWVIIILIYVNWHSYKYEESNDQSKVTVSFLVKNNNAPAQLQPINPPKLEEEQSSKIEPIKPAIKPSKSEIIKAKTEPKKLVNKNDKIPKIAQSLNSESVKKLENKNSEPILKKMEEKKKLPNKEIAEEIEEEETIETIDRKLLDGNPARTAQLLETDGLSTREKFNIEAQIKRCYKKIINQSDLIAIPIDVDISINKDGDIEMDEIKIANFEKYNDPKETNFRNRVDNIKKALIFCSPLRNLPKDKYEIWRELHLKFD